jgi:hypothetical protein
VRYFMKVDRGEKIGNVEMVCHRCKIMENGKRE